MSTDIIFVAIPAFYHSIHLPYNLLYLATYINEKSSFHASILDLKGKVPEDIPDEQFFALVLPMLKERNPGWIGLPCFTANYQFVMKFAENIKKGFECKVVVGNVHASLFPEDFIFQHSPVDYAVIGEGEETLKDLMEAVESGLNPCHVNGIAYYDPCQGFVKTAKRRLINDLDFIPIPDYSLIDMAPYLHPTMDLIRCLPMRGVGIYAGRGCPYKCIFCASNTIWKLNEGRPVRFRCPDKIIQEINLLVETYGIDGVYFVDDTLTCRWSNLLEFCEKIAPLRIIWGCNGRANEIEENIVIAMKEAGCMQIDFGVESGSDIILERIKKKAKVKDYIEGFRICHKHGMRAFANMMVNLPGETLEDIQNSIDLLKKIHPTRVVTAVTTPLPATELYNKYLDTKISKAEYHLLSLRTDQSHRFRFAAHDSVTEAYKRMTTTLRPLFPDYIRIFIDSFYIKAISRHHRCAGYLLLSIKRWIPELCNLFLSYTYHTLRSFPLAGGLATIIREKIFRRTES